MKLIVMKIGFSIMEIICFSVRLTFFLFILQFKLIQDYLPTNTNNYQCKKLHNII